MPYALVALSDLSTRRRRRATAAQVHHVRVHPDGSVLSVARGDGVVQLIALTKKVSAAEPNPLATPLRLRACVGVGERVYETCACVRGRVHT